MILYFKSGNFSEICKSLIKSKFRYLEKGVLKLWRTAKIKPGLIKLSEFFYWTTPYKLNITDWSQDNQKFSCLEITIFELMRIIAPSLLLIMVNIISCWLLKSPKLEPRFINKISWPDSFCQSDHDGQACLKSIIIPDIIQLMNWSQIFIKLPPPPITNVLNMNILFFSRLLLIACWWPVNGLGVGN